MSQSKHQTREFCNHSETFHEKNGDIVCRKCGLVLENEPLFEGDGKIPNEKTQINEISTLRPTIGFQKERTSAKFKRLANKNKQIQQNKRLFDFRKRLYFEVKRLLSAIQLPEGLRSDIITQGIHFYSLFEKGSRIRNPSVIGAASLYFLCLERGFFIRFNILKSLLDADYRYLRECIQKLYIKIPTLKKLNKPEFRKKLIAQQLHGLYETMKDENKNFIGDAREWIEQNWKYIDNNRDRMITALAYTKVRNRLTDTLAANFLGVNLCNISYAKKQLAQIKRGQKTPSDIECKPPETAQLNRKIDHLQNTKENLENKLRILKGKNIYLRRLLREQKQKTRKLAVKYDHIIATRKNPKN